jgi:hypothetical protein
MLALMNVGMDPLTDTLAWAQQNGVSGDWKPAAVYFLENYEERWQDWVTPEAFTGIKARLEE